MRDIKFRAWDKARKQLIPSENILKICFARTEHNPNLIVYTDRKINHFEEIRERDKKYCNDFELLQYTCLKDKNGKEVYEGDIFVHNNQKFAVIYDGTRFIAVDNDRSGNGYICYIDSCYKYWSSTIEVVGNVYESNLLKERVEEI